MAPVYEHAIELIEKTFSTSATSPDIDLRGWTLCGISFGSGFLGTSVTFTVSPFGVTFSTMIDGLGSTVTKTVAASRYCKLDPSDFAGVAFLRVISSNASEVGTIYLHCRRIL